MLTRNDMLSLLEAELEAIRNPKVPESEASIAARAFKVETRTTKYGTSTLYHVYGMGGRIEVHPFRR